MCLSDEIQTTSQKERTMNVNITAEQLERKAAVDAMLAESYRDRASQWLFADLKYAQQAMRRLQDRAAKQQTEAQAMRQADQNLDAQVAEHVARLESEGDEIWRR
jgi:uncharacterized protein YdaU (DUF1376 family)